MRMVYWLGDHGGWVLVVATIWMVVTILSYVLVAIVAGFDRDSSLLLVAGVSSVVGVWLTLLATAAAALAALRPPQAELSLSARIAPPSGPLQFIIKNSGRVAASDVVIELVTGRGGEPLEVVGTYWEVVDTEVPVHALLGQDSYRTVFKRWGSLPATPWGELVFAGVPRTPKGVRITASNAEEVHWHPEGHAHG